MLDHRIVLRTRNLLVEIERTDNKLQFHPVESDTREHNARVSKASGRSLPLVPRRTTDRKIEILA